MTTNHDLDHEQTQQVDASHADMADGEEAPPPGVRAAAIVRWFLVGAMALVAAVSVVRAWADGSGQGGAEQGVLYTCPMHPQIIQDRPGTCPICGMNLVPKKSTQQGEDRSPTKAAADGHEGHGGPPPQGRLEVLLAPERTQRIGMKTAKAERRTVEGSLRTTGFVAAAEDRVSVIQTRVSGWIERLHVARSGEFVNKGDVLFSLYSPELLAVQHELLSAHAWHKRASGHERATSTATLSDALVEAARRRLELLGVGRGEIDAIERSGKERTTLLVRSPIRGVVAKKSAVQGAFVEPSAPLFEIVDLSAVWMIAQVHEQDVARVKKGQKATASFLALPDKRVEGIVSFLYPAIESETRTLRVRIEFDNEGYVLRPGMFGEVVMAGEANVAVTVPIEALIDTGREQFVFVVEGKERFVPRTVRVGQRMHERVAILDGIHEGETVVTTGNFLIDSESQMRAALSSFEAKSAVAP